MKIDIKELNRIIEEETEKIVEKVEHRDPILMKKKVSKMNKDELISLLKESDISVQFIAENISPHFLFKVLKESGVRKK